MPRQGRRYKSEAERRRVEREKGRQKRQYNRVHSHEFQAGRTARRQAERWKWWLLRAAVVVGVGFVAWAWYLR